MNTGNDRQIMHTFPPLPEKLATYVGQIDAVEHPPQGTAFQVSILSSARGRFVLKVAHQPTRVAALRNESRILTALQEHIPFVAQPLDNALTDQGHAFLFTYIEGEPLHIVLNHSTVKQGHNIITQYAQALRRLHSWMPALPQPTDWLTKTLHWIGKNIQARPHDIRVAGTHSRFDGRDARQLFAELYSQRSALSNDLVFCHGDYCLPNVLIHSGQVMGVIDWSLGGYADRRFDLATALFSIRLISQNPDYLSAFLRAYGYPDSLEMLEFFEALHALTCAFWH